jgi:hypothetical protein
MIVTTLRWAEVAVLILAAAVLSVGVLSLPSCGDATSIQRAQVAVDTPAPDPRHTITERTYTSWCGPSCYAVTTERIERGEYHTWPDDVPTPIFPYHDPRTPVVPNVVCAPVGEP